MRYFRFFGRIAKSGDAHEQTTLDAIIVNKQGLMVCLLISLLLNIRSFVTRQLIFVFFYVYNFYHLKRCHFYIFQGILPFPGSQFFSIMVPGSKEEIIIIIDGMSCLFRIYCFNVHFLWSLSICRFLGFMSFIYSHICEYTGIFFKEY